MASIGKQFLGLLGSKFNAAADVAKLGEVYVRPVVCNGKTVETGNDLDNCHCRNIQNTEQTGIGSKEVCLYRHSWHRCLLHKCKSSHPRLSLITIDSCNTGHYVQFREGSLHQLAGDDESLESCSPIGSCADRQVCDISVRQHEFCLLYLLRTSK